jgi:ferric-dicitrate binding protein FerR (iron transport regulator)
MKTWSHNMDRIERDRIAEAAGGWDAQLRSPDCTPEDRQRFAEWRETNPAHAEAFERLQMITAGLRNERNRVDLRAMRDAALTLAKPRQRRVRWAIAAGVSAIALTAALWTLAPQLSGTAWGEYVARLGWGPANTYSTGIGQRSTITLQDGSTLELNAKTRVQVALSAERRSVELLDGQAIFNVAKDASRPFVVHAGGREIIAVGTAFDVRVDASAMQVTLLEGKVAVRPEGSRASLNVPLAAQSVGESAGTAEQRMEPSARAGVNGEPEPGARTAMDAKAEKGPRTVTSPRAGANATGSAGVNASGRAAIVRDESSGTIFLSPGQQLVVARVAEASSSATVSALSPAPAVVREIDIEKVTSWRDGRVFFEDLALTQAAAEMNKHSVVQIIVGDPALQELRVNGMFRVGEQQAFVNALEAYFPIEAERRGETHIVLRRRP